MLPPRPIWLESESTRLQEIVDSLPRRDWKAVASLVSVAIGRSVSASSVRMRYTRLSQDPRKTSLNRASSADGGKTDFLETKLSDDRQEIVSKSRRIKTLEQALEAAQVDRKIWAVSRHVINKWEVGAKGNDGEMVVEALWQVKVWLSRKAPKIITDAIDSLFQGYKTFRPVAGFANISKGKRKKDSLLLEFALHDAHFGKLCWGKETGTDYDTKLARIIYENAIIDLVNRVKGQKIEKVLLPIGGDFFHANNWIKTTANGTLLDLDTRMPKIFEAGCTAVINSINILTQLAPVEILWIPGNHDQETSWYLSKILQAWYRNVDSVSVDTSPKFRKYYQYGTCLLGYTHGDEEKHDQLPNIMAAEVPDMWSKTTHRHWRLGHLHKKRQFRYNAADTYGGVTVTTLPSLSGTDAWHYRKGYVHNKRCAEAYLWSREEGYVGHFSTNSREL